MAQQKNADTSKKGNMELWNKVCKSDKQYLKEADTKGGFTAIAAQYQFQTATEQWGMYGTTWGVKDIVYTEIRDAQNELTEVAIDGVFWYPDGSFPISSDIAFRKNGDTRKKLLTDITTKALSKLGFNADVFLDKLKWDGNKYVGDNDLTEDEVALLATMPDDVKEPMNDYMRKYTQSSGTFGIGRKQCFAIFKALDWEWEAIKVSTSIVHYNKEEKAKKENSSGN